MSVGMVRRIYFADDAFGRCVRTYYFVGVVGAFNGGNQQPHNL